MNEKFALIIPTYGQFDYVVKCLESMVLHASDYRCIVIDDGSPDWDDRWLEVFRKIVPAERFYFERFAVNRGLTAAWNHSLELARRFQNEYAVLVNSDTLFTPGWLLRTQQALEKVDLMGPLSNAAGGLPRQQIEVLWPGYRLDDSEIYLANLSARLDQKYRGHISPGPINGFWMAAKTETWWKNAFDATHVFDPKNRLTENETEFQKRFKGKIGTAQDVFIFHYRSVSRVLENVDPEFCVGAYRLGESPAPARHPIRNATVSALTSFLPEKARRILHVGFDADLLSKLEQIPDGQTVSLPKHLRKPETPPVSWDWIVKEAEAEPRIKCAPFDCLVLDNALEHASNPAQMLAAFSAHVKSGGYVLASFGNIRHYHNLLGLLKSHWPHPATGAYDPIQLRFFTRQNIEELFDFANLRIQKWRRIQRLGHRVSTADGLCWWGELFTAQYCVVGQKV